MTFTATVIGDTMAAIQQTLPGELVVWVNVWLQTTNKELELVRAKRARKKQQKIPFLTVRLVGKLFVLIKPLQFFGRKRTNVLCLVVEVEPLPTIKLIHFLCPKDSAMGRWEVVWGRGYIVALSTISIHKFPLSSLGQGKGMGYLYFLQRESWRRYSFRH